MIRVGTCKYKGSKRIDPSFEGFSNVIVLMKSHSRWGVLGPYSLKNEKGQIFENVYQFSRIYGNVLKTTQKYSRYDPKVIWEQDSEVHWKDGDATDEYWAWRKRGKNNEYAVRYPNGFKGKGENVKGVLVKTDEGYELVDYVEARKRIYCKEYCRLVRMEPLFKILKDRLKKENLLIIEVDGPKDPSYFKEKYNIEIENDTVLITKENINVFLNETKYSFGHGYCLACALLDKEEWLK